MSVSIGTFTTAHLGSASGPHGQPLPLRERVYGACAGHCACAMDWAVLTEMFAERYATDNTNLDSLHYDVYPNLVDSALFGANDLVSAPDALLQTAMSRYLDPGWTPQDIDGFGWMYFKNAESVGGLDMHAYRRTSRRVVTNLASGSYDKQKATADVSMQVDYRPRTPRCLEDVRRMYYDAKKMCRIETNCTVTYEGISYSHYERFYNGSEYGEGPESITLGSDIRNIHRRVRETDGYSVRSQGNGKNAFAMVEMWCDLNHPGVYRSSAIKRTLCIPCALGGTLDMSRFSPDALKSWTKSVYGEFTSGNDYYAECNVSRIYADVNFPADHFFTGWNWQPTQGD